MLNFFKDNFFKWITKRTKKVKTTNKHDLKLLNSKTNNFCDFFKSIFFQNKNFHKYFIVFDFRNDRYESIFKQINDEMFLTTFAN